MKIPNDVLPPAYSESTQPIPTQEHAGPSQPPPLTLTLAHPSTTESRSLEWTSRWAFRPSSTLNASNYPSSTLRRLESLPKSSRTANYNYLKRMAETEAKGVAYFREKSLAWIGLWDMAAVWWDERWML